MCFGRSFAAAQTKRLPLLSETFLTTDNRSFSIVLPLRPHVQAPNRNGSEVEHLYGQLGPALVSSPSRLPVIALALRTPFTRSFSK